MQVCLHTCWVIGYGNAWRRDDGIGPLVVGRVADILKPNERVRFLTLPQLDLNLIEPLRRAGLILFVDATIENLEHGWAWKKLHPQMQMLPYLSHHIHPSFLLGLVQAIDQRTIPCWQVSIQGYDFRFGARVSSSAKERAEAAILNIVRLIKKWIDTEKKCGKNIPIGVCHE